MTTASELIDTSPTRTIMLAWSIVGVVLIASTWPLWWRSTSTIAFPEVPFWLALNASWFEQILVIGMIASLVVVGGYSLTARDDRLKLGCFAFVFAGWLLVLFNVHRLQPWMYHFLLLGLVFASLLSKNDSGTSPVKRLTESRNPEHRRRLESTHVELLLVLTCSIYIWSGVSKFDYSFANSYGQQFVNVLLKPLGITTHLWSNSAKQISALALPLGETLTGILLLIGRTRRIGLVFSFLMHGALLVIVGPVGMNHEPGVLIWNVFFIVQNSILWRFSEHDAAPPEAIRETNESDNDPALASSSNPETATSEELATEADARSIRWARIVVMAAVTLPVLRIAGWFDVWPSWGVYAANTTRVHILIDRTTIESDAEITQFLTARQVQDGREYLRLDRWSIESCNAPVYPEDRFHVAVCLALYDAHPGIEIETIWESTANRWNGKRTTRRFRSQAELERFAQQFWLNVRAIR